MPRVGSIDVFGFQGTVALTSNQSSFSKIELSRVSWAKNIEKLVQQGLGSLR